jgi:hypothetical protein
VEVNRRVMMEKKRSFGIIITSIILFLFPFIVEIILRMALVMTTGKKSLWIWNEFIRSYWFAFIFFGILGMGILRLNNKIRLVTVAITTAMAAAGPLGLIIGIFVAGSKIHIVIIKKIGISPGIFPWLIVIPICLLYALIAIYLTRLKVKRQFTGAESPQPSGGDKGAV